MVAQVISSNTSSGYTLNATDTLTVQSGGESSGSVVNAGGFEIVAPGGASLNDTIAASGAIVVNSGSIFPTASVQNLTVAAGATAFLYSGTQFTGGTDAGTVIVSGSTNTTNVNNLVVTNGGIFFNSGAFSVGTTVMAGGQLQDTAGGTVARTGLSGQAYIISGGMALATQISAGGIETIMAGGSAGGTTVSNGGSEVLLGGSASNETILSGGMASMQSGGALVSTTISAGGTVSALSGTVSGVTIGAATGGAAAGELLMAGAALSGSIVNNGDITFAYGMAGNLAGTALSGTGTVTLSGNGKIVFAGTDTGTGAVLLGYGVTAELATGSAAGTGALTFQGGGTLIFDAAAPANVISGMAPYSADVIVLNNIGAAAATIAQTNGDFVTITGGGVTDTLDIAGSQAYSFTGATSGGSFVLTEQVACFLRGGMIATPGGEVPVEALRPGDRVTLLDGESVAVRWIGTGAARITDANRCDVSPVIIRRGALADGVPARDLRLTRRHCVLVDGVLVPAELLVNDASILLDAAADHIEFFHVETDCHAVLIADGAPCESFRDDGSFALFDNAAERPARPLPTEACRPVVVTGPLLDAAWRMLAARAGALPADALVTDPDLHLEQDGRRIAAFAAEGGIHRFRLRPGRGDIMLCSRSAIPAALGAGPDERRMGVALTGMAVGGALVGPEALSAGVHAMEGGHRWTKGRTVIPGSLFADRADEELELAVHVAGTLLYRAPPSAASLP